MDLQKRSSRIKSCRENTSHAFKLICVAVALRWRGSFSANLHSVAFGFIVEKFALLRPIYTEKLPGVAVHERRITRRNKTSKESCAATPSNSSV